MRIEMSDSETVRELTDLLSTNMELWDSVSLSFKEKEELRPFVRRFVYEMKDAGYTIVKESHD